MKGAEELPTNPEGHYPAQQAVVVVLKQRHKTP